jgi:hypothetical protein
MKMMNPNIQTGTDAEKRRSLMCRIQAGFLALSLVFVVGTWAASPAWAFAPPPVAKISVQKKGEVYPSISCTATGVKWGGVTRGFVSYTEITYHWTIKRNGVVLITGEHGGYFTDSVGNHDRLPSGFPQAADCGKGLYTIDMYADGISSGKYYYTGSGAATAVCN